MISEYPKIETISKYIIWTVDKNSGWKGKYTIKTLLTLSQPAFISHYIYQGLFK